MSEMSRSRRGRVLRTVALVVLAMFTLASCIKVDLSVALHENNTADGNVVFALSDASAEQIGRTPDELWAEIAPELTEGWPDATEEPFAEDGFTGTRMAVSGLPLGDLADLTGQPLRVVREGDEFVVTGMLNLAQLAREEGAESMMLAEDMRVTIQLTCPGRVLESNGAISGNAITWTPATTGDNQFQARCLAVVDEAPVGQTPAPVVTAPQAADEGIPRWIPALGIAFLAGVAGLATYLWRRSHHHERSEYLGLEQFDGHYVDAHVPGAAHYGAQSDLAEYRPEDYYPPAD